MNRESGLVPQVYNLLSNLLLHLTLLFDLTFPQFISPFHSARVTVFLIIAHLFPNYHTVSCHVSVLKAGFCNTSLITDDDHCIVCRNV